MQHFTYKPNQEPENPNQEPENPSLFQQQIFPLSHLNTHRNHKRQPSPTSPLNRTVSPISIDQPSRGSRPTGQSAFSWPHTPLIFLCEHRASPSQKPAADPPPTDRNDDLPHLADTSSKPNRRCYHQERGSQRCRPWPQIHCRPLHTAALPNCRPPEAKEKKM